MSANDFAVYLITGVERLLAQCMEAQRDRTRVEDGQAIFAKVLPLLTQFVQSPVAQEFAGVLHARMQDVLEQYSGASLITVLVAEYLRGQIQTIEGSAHRLIDASDETSQRRGRGCGKETPELRAAVAVSAQAGILDSKLHTIESACAVLPLIIPPSLETMAARLRIATALVAAAAPRAASAPTAPAEGRATVVDAAPAEGDPANAESAAIASLPSDAPHFRYRTHRSKARDLRCATHAFGDLLRASLARLRGEIDAAQGNGWYNPTALAAVAEALCKLAMETTRESRLLTARANAPVKLFGKGT